MGSRGAHLEGYVGDGASLCRSRRRRVRPFTAARRARHRGARPARLVARHPLTGARVWLALLVVYVVWGSTYLGILLTIRTIPVFLMTAVRFLVAGALLYLWSIRRGDRDGDRPGRKQWAAAAGVGAA